MIEFIASPEGQVIILFVYFSVVFSLLGVGWYRRLKGM